MRSLPVITETRINCGSCTACCDGWQIVPLTTGDLARKNDWRTNRSAPGLSLLAHTANGDCVYLDGDGKCSIYEDRPEVCRMYDCRDAYLKNIGGLAEAHDSRIAQSARALLSGKVP